MASDRDQFEADPWGAAVEVPEWGPAEEPESTPEPGPEPTPEHGPGSDPVDADGPRDAPAPADLPARRRRSRATLPARLRALARPPLALLLGAAGALAVVGIADGWRLLILAAFVAAGVVATRLRFSAQAALGLLLVVALFAVGGWGPGSNRRPPNHRAKSAHARGQAHHHPHKAKGKA